MSDQHAPYPAWIYRQSALLPFRGQGETLEVLLVSSRSGKRWLLPKGIVEPGMSPLASACKEAREEAGVEGAVGATPLGSYHFLKPGGRCEAQVFPLAVSHESDDWPEASFRRRRWLPLAEAMRRVDDKGLRGIIERLPSAVSSPGAVAAFTVVDATPPRLIYLLRHAKSSWDDSGLSDEQRPLAPRGKRACASMSRYLALANVHPEQVLCSSAVRTRQTLAGVLSAMGKKTPVQFDPALYLADTQTMLGSLRRCGDDVRSVMLIAHNPGTQELALHLAGAGEATELARLETKFPTAALAILVYRDASWATLGDGDCVLHSHVWPRDIGEDPDFG